MKRSNYTRRELEFAKELGGYENRWVAIMRKGSNEKVVASGERIIDAKREADEKGFKDVSFMKVPAFDKVYIL